jgi:hypothetical protein
MDAGFWFMDVQHHFQQFFFIKIMTQSFIYGVNLSTLRKPNQWA